MKLFVDGLNLSVSNTTIFCTKILSEKKIFFAQATKNLVYSMIYSF